MPDEKVFAAQKWVNETYRGVKGYECCPENGRTGWSTMYSLIMGLQHELGISPVEASFGPATIAKFQRLGEIGPGWNHNPNIVAILEHAMFCKGYWGVEEVKRLRSNMGIPEGNGSITVQIAKCILNMDAYIVVAGGTDKIREIQRWLNNRYWEWPNYCIGPADGIYSRDVQRAVIFALQHALDLEPTGHFGDGTRSRLRSHPLSLGNAGLLVQLFSAACVFNEPVGSYRTNQRESFDDTLVKYVKAFQRFSQLTDNGRGDYQTWCQLLVSMGDPDRPAAGSDTRFEITESRAKWLIRNGYKIVGRYLYNPPGSLLDKAIKPGELKTIFDHGLRVFPIYQENGRELANFTYSTGYQHACNAHLWAAEYGFNKGTVIYFSVDFDAKQDAIEAAIIPYFRGVATGLVSCGRRYLHGVYGSRNVCKNVTRQTFARYSFVAALSYGYSGNLGFPLPSNWSFNQIKELKNITNGRDAFDLDRVVWRKGFDPGTSSLKKQAGPADAFIAYIQKLYDLALAYKSDRSSSQLVMEYVRHAEYGDKDLFNKWGWRALIGSYDEGFVQYVKQHAKQRKIEFIKHFQDPFTGYDIGAEHMMATANGHFLYPQSNPKSANRGDVAGWAGDLMTFYADWRNSEEKYVSGQAFCEAKLANPVVDSSFGFSDLIEDADGYLIAHAVHHGKTIVEAVHDHYNGNGSLRRFHKYFTLRWGTAANAKLAAHTALTTPDYILGLARKRLITLAWAMLPSILITVDGGLEKLEGFEQGFVDALLLRISMEKTKPLTTKSSALVETDLVGQYSDPVFDKSQCPDKQIAFAPSHSMGWVADNTSQEKLIITEEEKETSHVGKLGSLSFFAGHTGQVQNPPWNNNNNQSDNKFEGDDNKAEKESIERINSNLLQKGIEASLNSASQGSYEKPGNSSLFARQGAQNPSWNNNNNQPGKDFSCG